MEPREGLLRGRSLALLHSLQGSKPFFNIGDNEQIRDGRDRTREDEVTLVTFLKICIGGDRKSGQKRLAFPSRKEGFLTLTSKQVNYLFRLEFFIKQIREKNHIENAPNPSPSFVEPCIVSDPNLPGASLP